MYSGTVIRFYVDGSELHTKTFKVSAGETMSDFNAKPVHTIFEGIPFLELLGIELIGCGPGWCETKLDVSPSHKQQHGYAHAGVSMTIADHTCGGAAATTLGQDDDVITVENKTTFLRPGTGQSLVCRAEVLRSGKSLIFVEAEVFGIRDGKRVLVAKSSSTVARVAKRVSETTV
jgi:uncharacterized protein (TIGR00369 family)